ncbi:MAG: zf-HC2 domain-containing protein [Actinomycetota bacterium]
MRCKGAIKQIGPFIDGELGEAEARALREHLDSCEECSRRYHYMRGLVRQLSSLPAIVPTPEESYRLWNLLRREMAVPSAPRPLARRTQLAAAALSVLVLITVTGVGLAVWSSGGPAPVAEEPVAETARSGEAQEESWDTTMPGASAGTGLMAAAVARPDVVVSQNEYDAGDLEDFRNDLGTRLDFYSTYWYPSSGGTASEAALEDLQAELTGDLTEQAAAAGQDPRELERAVAAVMEQASDEPILPCYAERAKIAGKDAWLISVSGPEDYLLFPDPQKPPAMILASLGGEESLKLSESALKELASILAPSGKKNAPLVPAGTFQQEEEAQDETAAEEPASDTGKVTEETQTGEGQSQLEEDFQSFLRRLAAQGTSLDTLSALQDLNYEQVLQLLQGDWGSLASGGVNLSDFLTPPQRLWAVDCASGEIIWSAE